MKPASRKAKARRLQNLVAQQIQQRFNLSEADVKPAVMGENGTDLKLSSPAQVVFPFAVECKNSERLNIWAALAQAENNANGLYPAVVFSRNRAGVYIALRFEDFLGVVK